jgi:hypothetical protein
MSNAELSFGIIFGLAAAYQVFEVVRALATKRVRRITFRKRFVGLSEDATDFWLATIYHGVAAIFIAYMSALTFAEWK